MTKVYSAVFGIILVIGILTRFLYLGQIPSSLNWDEVSHGYNAYSIMNTGRDQWGHTLPLFNFRAYGDYPTTLNLYLTIPFIKFFGLNAFSIRLPSTIISLLFIVLIYYFSQHILKSHTLGLFCMFLAAISPWTLFPGRAVFQSNFSQFLILSGIYFFILGPKNSKTYLLSALSFGLSMYSYHNARIIVPLIIPTLVYFNFQKIKINNSLVVSLLLFLLLAVPNFLNLFSPESTARNQWVGIINPNSINLINESRRLYEGPEIFNRLINNKVVYFTKTLSINYLNLFNPIPLFLKGSQNFQFNPPDTGLIFSIFMPFFYLGLLKIFLPSKQRQIYQQLFIILIILLLPSALTVGDFPSIRATVAMPLYLIFIALGLPPKRKLLFNLIILISTIQFINYLKIYKQYNLDYSQSWQYGYEQTINFAKQNYDKYDQIVFTKKYGEPHEFVLFYWPWDPNRYLNDSSLKWDYHAAWYWIDAFDKFKFVNDWEIKKNNYAPRTLLITSPGNYPSAKSKIIKTINFLDGTPAFDIISYD